MENPQISKSAIISPKEMFAYDNHKSIPWNINQYQVPTLPYDYKDVIRKRQYATQKKGVKTNDFYVTKRGFYMDYSLKVGATVPGSNSYQKQQPWPHQKHDLDQEGLKQHRSMIKYSYLQRIQMQQKNRSKPGVGTYNIQKSLDQIKLENNKKNSIKRKIGEKRYFYEDTQHLADKLPGPGTHNPHEQVPHLTKTRTDNKFWVDKHKKELSLNTTRDLIKPNPASYSPLHQSYTTFLTTMSKSKKQWVKKNGFGSDARFPYVRQNKKIIIQERPAPCTYQTKIEWKGKQVSPLKKRWTDIIYTGSPPKVYH